MAVIIIGVLVLLGLAVLFVIGSARRRRGDRSLSRETRHARRLRAGRGPAPAEAAARRRTPKSPRTRGQRADDSRRAIESGSVGAGPGRVRGASPATSRSTRRSSASPGASSSTGGSSLACCWPSAGSAPPCSASCGPAASSAGGFGSHDQHRQRSPTSRRRSPSRCRTTTPTREGVHQPVPEVADLPKAKKVYTPIIVRRDGARLRRPLPALRAPGLPGAVVPDLAVVRVPLPRLEVQPGRGEEAAAPRRGASTGSRSTISGGAMTVDTGTIILGPPIGTNTTGQAAEGALCV